MLSSIEVPKHVLDVVKTLTSQHCENADALHAALRNEHDATAAKLESVDGHLGEVDGEGKTQAKALDQALDEITQIAIVHAKTAAEISRNLGDSNAEILRVRVCASQSHKLAMEVAADMQRKMYYLFGGSTAFILAAIALVKYL